MVECVENRLPFLLQFKKMHFRSQEQFEEHLWSSKLWQGSHTRTGFGYDGSESSLLEHVLQKISPQFRQ